MLNRQDMRIARVLSLFTGIAIVMSACQASELPAPKPAPAHQTTASLPVAQISTATPADISIQPSPIPVDEDNCDTQKGTVERSRLQSKKLPGDLYFSIYLPACYSESESYPVLYLLHGITYSDDQWIRLGAQETVDEYISSGVAAPVIIVLPNNPNPQRPPDSNFGEALVLDLIPYIDANYATCTERDCRMIGGVSRGGGWAWDIFMDYPQLFGTVAGHSPAFFQRIPSLLVHRLEGLLQGQRLWLDVGEQDPELNYLTSVHEAMDASGIKHEFHVYQGTHTEEYWKTNLSEYLLWYLAGYSPP